MIHTIHATQAIAQTEIALKAGMDGVYLIDHGSDATSAPFGVPHLANIAVAARDAFGPDTHIGVNFLGISPAASPSTT